MQVHDKDRASKSQASKPSSVPVGRFFLPQNSKQRDEKVGIPYCVGFTNNTVCAMLPYISKVIYLFYTHTV